MVDSGKDKTYKSLSADSELQSGYEYLYKGDYKQCKRTIDKKVPKLKSDLDKFNFNILKIQLLHRTKKYRDAKVLIATVKKEALTNTALSHDVVNFFKNVLIDLNDEQSASEILKHTLKSVNLAKISKTEQMKLLKELCLNCEFSEMYGKIAGLLKNEHADVKFLTLMKYEMIYILAFRYEKLSKLIASATLKEMLNNYDKYCEEKGFIDILVKFLICLGDSENFIKLFEGKKVPFTNAPVEDLLIDIYLKKGDSLRLVNHLIQSIRSDVDKCNFNTYQRLISYIVSYYKQNSLLDKFDINVLIKSDGDIDLDSFNVTDLSDINSTFRNLTKFLTHIHNKRPNFNAYKSAIYSKLLLYHYIIIHTGHFTDFIVDIYELVRAILAECHNKQSLLMEVKKYFIYLDDNLRGKLYGEFAYEIYLNREALSDDDKERVVYGLKLQKLLSGKTVSNTNELIDYTKSLFEIYNKLTACDIKLEKGERIIGDDIIILINERYHEYVNHNNDTSKEFIELSYLIYSINSYAHSRSPYNYDLSMYLLKICGHLHMNNRVLEVLKFMNLKGPQFETVSYIAFPYFYYSQYKPGLSYLIESFERWEKENKRSIRKTLWKMFTGRNYWNSEELLTFFGENNSSHYKYIIKSIDLVLTQTDNLVNPSNEDTNVKESFTELLEEMGNLYLQYEKEVNADKVVNNQDLVISIFKFKYVGFFNNDHEMLKRNPNYKRENYKYAIDSLEKDTIIHEEYPGYKNNFLLQHDVPVFGLFDDKQYLSKYIFNKLSFLPIYLDKPNQDAYEKYKSLTINYSSDQISQLVNKLEYYDSTLYSLYSTFAANIDSLSDEAIDKYYSSLKNDIIDSFNGLRSNYLEGELFNYQTKRDYYNTLSLFSRFYLVNITIMTSKLLDLVNNNKKTLKDKAGNVKTSVMNHFKSALVTHFNDNNEHFGTTSQVNKASETLMKCLDGQKMLLNNESFIKELLRAFTEEVKESNKDMKENSRSFKNYIKDNI
jgi:hypothetical protein